MILTGEPPLPRRVIEPLKMALAIAIVYGIAFYMEWGKIYWASVSAVSVNLLSTGLTLHRGVIRTFGTALGGFAGLAIIAMFPQERWAFLISASIVLFFLGYFVTGKKEPYLFLIILITFMVIMAVVQSSDYTDSGAAFEVVMLRVTQTWMGSLVMILIMVFVYPLRTVDDFEDLARARWGIQHKIFNAYRGMLFGRPAAEETKHWRMEDAPLHDYSHFRLHGAEQDTFEMLEVGHDWHNYLHLTSEQYEALESLRQSLADVEDLDLTKYITNLETVATELGLRFEQTERMLGKQESTYIAQHLAVTLNEEETRALPHLQEAAVRMVRRQLEKLEQVSLSLYDCVAKIRMYDRPTGVHHHHGHGGHGFGIDPFRLRTTLAFVAAVYVAFFIWVYVYDIPRGSLFTCFVVITASISSYRPEAPQLTYGAGWLIGVLAAFFTNVLIMHQISGYLEFTVMIVLSVFLIQYLTFQSFHPIGRIFITIGFLIATDAENHQHYGFQHYVETFVWMLAAVATTLIVKFAFLPLRPDVMFMRTLDHFFRRAEFMLSAYDADGKPDRSLSRRFRSIFNQHSLLQEAERLALFAGQVDPKTGQTTYKMTRGATPEQMQDLVRSVYALAHRIEGLVEARKAPLADRLEAELMDEKREWLAILQEWFRRRPGEAQATGLAADYEARLAQLEKRIDQAFARIGEEELKPEEYEGFYGLLGSYRGLSEATVEFARVAETFDWAQWRETRF